MPTIVDPVPVQFDLNRPEKEAFQIWCRANDITMSQFLRRQIRAQLRLDGLSPPYDPREVRNPVKALQRPVKPSSY